MPRRARCDAAVVAGAGGGEAARCCLWAHRPPCGTAGARSERGRERKGEGRGRRQGRRPGIRRQKNARPHCRRRAPTGARRPPCPTGHAAGGVCRAGGQAGRRRRATKPAAAGGRGGKRRLPGAQAATASSKAKAPGRARNRGSGSSGSGTDSGQRCLSIASSRVGACAGHAPRSGRGGEGLSREGFQALIAAIAFAAAAHGQPVAHAAHNAAGGFAGARR